MAFDVSKAAAFPGAQQTTQNAPANGAQFDVSKAASFGGNANNATTAPAPQPKGPGAFMSFVTGFNNSVDQLSIGALQGLGQAIGMKTPGLDAALMRSNQEAAMASAAHPTATFLGGLTGDLGKYLPLGVAGGTSLAGMVGSGAIGSAIIGGAEAPEEGETRFSNAGEQGLIGALGGAVGYGINAGMKLGKAAIQKGASLIGDAAKNVTSEGAEQSVKEFAENAPSVGGMSGLEQAADAEAAAKRLGTFLSGTESTASPVLRNLALKEVQKTPERSAQVQQIVMDRDAALSGAFKGLAKDVNPATIQETQGQATALYNELKPRQLPVGAINKLMQQDSYVGKLYLDAHKVLNFENVKPGSWEDLDLVRKHIDDKIKYTMTSLMGAQAKGQSSGSGGAIINDLLTAKDEVTTAMRSVDPEDLMSKADTLWGKAAFEKSLNVNLNKFNPDKPMGPQIYKKYFSTPEKQAAFLSKMERFGTEEGVQKTKDLINVMSKIQDSPLNKFAKGSTFTKGSATMLDQRPTLYSAAVSAGKDLVTKKYDKKLYDLMLDKSFSDTIKGIGKGDKGLLDKLVDLGNTKASFDIGGLQKVGQAVEVGTPGLTD